MDVFYPYLASTSSAIKTFKFVFFFFGIKVSYSHIHFVETIYYIFIYQVFCQVDNKARYIKGRIDVFVDDSINNFIQMNCSGVPCLLMDTKYNQSWGPIGRIYTLDYNEIEESYYLMKETFLTNFKKYLL